MGDIGCDEDEDVEDEIYFFLKVVFLNSMVDYSVLFIDFKEMILQIGREMC